MTGHHRIAGRPVAGAGPRFRPVDPRTGQEIAASYPEATAEEITSAVDAAVAAAPALRTLPSDRRAVLLDRLVAGLERRADSLVALADVETALGRDLLAAELGDTCARLRALRSRVADGADVSAAIDTTSRTARLRVARGPVALLGASDSPFTFGAAGVDPATALVAGAPVVSKACAAHPGTAQALGAVVDQALGSAGWPAGAHGLLHGRRPLVSEELVAAPGIEAVGHVGRVAAGRVLFDLAGARPAPIPFLGGFETANPVVVLPGAAAADRARSAEAVVTAVAADGARALVRPGLLLVPDTPDGEWLLDEVAVRMRALGRRFARTPERAAEFAEGAASRLGAPGVVGLVEGCGEQEPGFAQHPVLLAVGVDDLLASEELRTPLPGPLLVAVRCAPERVAEVLDDLDGALVGGVLTCDDPPERIHEVVAVLAGRVGRVVVDAPLDLPPPSDPLAVHGGPWPAAVDGGWSGLGPAAIARWQRPVAFREVPDAALPPALRADNPLGLVREVDGRATRARLPQPRPQQGRPHADARARPE